MVLDESKIQDSYITKGTVFCAPNKSIFSMEISKSPLTRFIEENSWLTAPKIFGALLGDFNVDVLCDNVYASVCSVLTHCKLVVTESTHLNRGLLAHVYLAKLVSLGKHINRVVKNIKILKIFVYHDAVKVQIYIEKRKETKKRDFTVTGQNFHIQL